MPEPGLRSAITDNQASGIVNLVSGEAEKRFKAPAFEPGLGGYA
jgi:hypothetical protein